MTTPRSPNKTPGSLTVNLGISAATVILFLLFFEFVVFRFVMPGSDVPRNAFVNDIVRYEPNQKGIWRVRDEISAPYAINAQGWNSGLGDYAVERKPGVMRVAVVGDSNVEAFQVRYDASLGEHLARNLEKQLSQPVEVYRFAIGGAPLSQYLHMIEREVLRYKPDWIVVLLIHNDFDESFEFVPGRYTSSFLKLKIEDAKVVGEIQPSPWRAGPADWLRHTATLRFFYYRWQVRAESLKSLFIASARATDAGVATLLPKREDIRTATEYIFRRIADAARRGGARLQVAIDGDRSAIYAGQTTSAFLALNAIAAEKAEKVGISFLDLHSVFQADWQAHKMKLDFVNDYHLNERGHALAGEAIARAMQRPSAR